MPPHSVPNDGPSAAFHDQFSTVIRQKSRLNHDHSENVTGPARRRWVSRHLREVAQAQGFTIQPFTEPSTLSPHAREFIASPPAQTVTDNHSGLDTPWYNNFYLADQDSLDPSGHQLPAAHTVASRDLTRPSSHHHPFDPIELSAYRATNQAQLFPSSNQQAERWDDPSGQASGGSVHNRPDPYLCSYHSLLDPQAPTTLPANIPPVRFPSTPPSQSARHFHHHVRQASSLDDLSTLATTTVPGAADADSTVQPETGSLSTPTPHQYAPLTIYAIEIQIGDYIPSVQHPGKVTDHCPCSYPDRQPPDVPPVSPNGGLSVRIEGADGQVRTRVFKGLDKVRVLRETTTSAKGEDGEGKVEE